MAAAVARDLIIVLGAIAYRLWLGPIEVRPIGGQQAQHAVPGALHPRRHRAAGVHAAPPAWVVVMLGAFAFVTIAVSGIDYVLRYGKAALRGGEVAARDAGAGGSKLT